MSFNTNLNRISSRNGSIDGPDNTQDIANALASTPSTVPLVIWFHGGLVDVNAGNDIANRVGTSIMEGDAHFPVFFVWDSGLSHELPDAILAFAKRKLGQGVVQLIKGLVEAKLGFRLGAAPEPNAALELTDLDKQILEEAVDQNPLFLEEAQALAMGPGAAPIPLTSVVTGPVTPADERLQARLQQMAAAQRPAATAFGPLEILSFLKTVVIDIGGAVLRRYANHREHGIVQTIIEEGARKAEIPKDVWDAIKADAVANFEPNGAGARLIQALRTTPGALDNRTVFLVGHSTGAIMIESFLDEAASAGVNNAFEVRFLGAAARCESMSNTLQAHQGRINSIRSFGMKDEQEKIEPLFAGVPGVSKVPALANLYQGSLLYMVSGALEDVADAPLVGMQRFINSDGSFLNATEKEAVDSVRAAVIAKDNRSFVWTPTDIGAPDGFCGKCTTHGGFDDALELGPGGCVPSLLIQ